MVILMNFRQNLFKVFNERPGHTAQLFCNVVRDKIFWGRHTMQSVSRKVAKVELDSTSATVVPNFAKKVALCDRALSICSYR